MITAEYLRSILNYDPLTGNFMWRERADARIQWNARYAGALAGRVTNKGYVQIQIGLKRFLAHRLAWLTSTGAWPGDQLDHINRDRVDNRIVNLRIASAQQNVANTPARCTSKSGVKGVRRRRDCNRYQARIKVHGKERSIGYFKTREDAESAYILAASEAFGEFANIETSGRMNISLPPEQVDALKGDMTALMAAANKVGGK